MSLILRCKVVIVGDAKVGKSAITQMFHSGGKSFPKNYVMTLGVDFCVKVINIPDTDVAVELYIFDTAGDNVFNELQSRYWADASMLFVVYDITNQQSFHHCSSWIEAVQAANPDRNLGGVLVAAKTDLNEFSEVQTEDAQALAAEHSLEFFQCCALDSTDIDVPFTYIANCFYNEYEDKLKVLDSI